MTWQEVAFADARCRIEVSQQAVSLGLPSFVAHMWLLEDAGMAHPLVLDSGEPAVVHAETEALALSTAVTYLAARFGPLSEYAHACPEPAGLEPPGRPVVIDHVS